jgi:hypothetical protein
MVRLKSFCRLIRLPNIITAAADIITGILVVLANSNYEVSAYQPFFLIFASCCLYAGGVSLNDVVDADIDFWESPKRPIPSGEISNLAAIIIAWLFLISGVLLASMVNSQSQIIAIFLLIAIISYDFKLKNHKLIGSFNMGLCRGLNLLLGLSLVPNQIENYAPLIIIPFIHITAVTFLSQGEAEGLSRKEVLFSVFPSFGLVYLLFVLNQQIKPWAPETIIFILAYTALLAWGLLPALISPTPDFIRRGVKFGILSLVLLNGVLIVIFSSWIKALSLLILVILTIKLSRWFSMT